MVQVPARIRGLRWMIAVTGIYGVVWIALEGDLRRALLLALFLSLLGAAFLYRRLFRHRERLPLWLWLLTGVGHGALVGFLLGPATLVAMAMKTGLHAHGPEFTPEQIAWVVRQMPVWLIAGIVAGLAFSLVYFGFRGTHPGGGAN